MTRRKAPKQPAPQTIEEAAELAGRYAGMLTATEQLRADADRAIAKIEVARDSAIAPIEEEAKGIFLQLRAWWGVAGETLTEGKRKSTELAGCVLGVRTTPRSVSTGKLRVGEAISRLVDAGMAQLLRWKAELDKPQILKALDEPNIGDRLRELGFRAVQKEEFFIDRAGGKPADVEEVKILEAAE